MIGFAAMAVTVVVFFWPGDQSWLIDQPALEMEREAARLTDATSGAFQWFNGSPLCMILGMGWDTGLGRKGEAARAAGSK